MGLSASQARLLSITQRLNNNELESQILSNAKIQLSTKNTLATEKYIAALDSTEMQYISYNDNGITESIALTFNSLTAYSPLKNQYNLYNAQGQLMVNEEDARNFETSNTLSEFLMKNGLDKFWADYDIELTEYNTKYANYEKEMEDYKKRKTQYEIDLKNYYEKELPNFAALMTQYEKDLKTDEENERVYNELLAEYNLLLRAPDLHNIFTSAVVGNSHYNDAKNNDPGCFLHVLNNLIDFNGSGAGLTAATYQTSAKDASGNPILLENRHEFENNNWEMPELAPVAQGMVDATYEKYYLCDGNDVGTTGGIDNNLLKNAIEVEHRQPTIQEQLASDYYIDATTGKYEKKTLRQKTIDLYYLLANCIETKNTRPLGSGGFGSGEFTLTQNGVTVASYLTDYVEGDMKGLKPKAPDVPVKLAICPTPPTLPSPPPHPKEPIPPNGYNYPVEDKEKAQWYTNLWHAMDGHDTTAQLSLEHDENASFTNYLVPDGKKTSNMDIIEATYNADGTIKEILKAKQLNKYYTVIDKANATDSSWLQYMLTSGTITMQQAALRTTGFITWEGIEFSSTSDIREVQNDTKIAKAEAEYEEAVAQIQAEDKIIDAKNKKLDTEHSALKTEIDSIKNVLSKNIEKSFNAFS